MFVECFPDWHLRGPGFCYTGRAGSTHSQTSYVCLQLSASVKPHCYTRWFFPCDDLLLSFG